MDAQTLYHEGVVAIRDQKDVTRGRDLLVQCLQLDPGNDMAWLWLTHTVGDRDKRLHYIERALAINPQNQHALMLKNRLLESSPPKPETPAVSPVNSSLAIVGNSPAVEPAVAEAVQRRELSDQERKLIEGLLNEAEAALTSGNTEGAIAKWVAILNMQVDHEIAIRNAVSHLWRLNYRDDAKELIWRALNSSTRVPSIYLTAIDIAEREQNYAQAEKLRTQVASMPEADDKLLLTIVDQYMRTFKFDQAIEFLRGALDTHPNSQPLLNRLGDLYQSTGRVAEAMKSYDEAVRLKPRSREARDAEQKLVRFVPVLSDRERGSVWLAVREVIGIGFLYLLMGWQDAGLNLLLMGPLRWLGILLSMLGGYLLVTATSSPQQVPIAEWFGASMPPLAKPKRKHYELEAEEQSSLPIISSEVRAAIGIIGAILLVIAFALVFQQALDLLFDYHRPYIPLDVY